MATQPEPEMRKIRISARPVDVSAFREDEAVAKMPLGEKKVLASYAISSEGIPAEVTISKARGAYVRIYELSRTGITSATKAALDYLKEGIVEGIQIKSAELLDPNETEAIKARLVAKAHELVREELGGMSTAEETVLVGRLVQQMLGLGDLEFLLADDQLEEVVVNSAKEPVWVYHRKFGWLKSNIRIENEDQIQNYAAIIGRKVGRQITTLNPLMDANLLSGDRVNATLAPISSRGNTITVRKFAREPWTMVGLIENKTLDLHSAALLWLALRFEMNILVAGGTASGKTSFLNAMLGFTPADQRIVTLEDTRELVLPEFLNWTPMSTRQANPEGKGEVTLLDLAVNSLRMRPDRIVLGEVRRQAEAEVLFEAMHTGHAVYATVHADDSEQVKNRLVNPPISLPEQTLGALHLVVTQYRQRRTGARRTYEIGEVLPHENGVSMNVVYKWDSREDRLLKVGEHIRLVNELTMHTGMTGKEIEHDIAEKENVLANMMQNGIRDVNSIGRLVASYYEDPAEVLAIVEKKGNLRELLG